MKQPKICLVILIIIAACSFAACSLGGLGIGSLKCSSKKEVCISLSPVEPIHFGQPVIVTISVSSTKDISDLYVTLHADGSVDGPQGWESYLTSSSVWPTYGMWGFAIKAGQNLTFTRMIHFPAEKGLYHTSAEVAGVGRIYVGEDFFYVYLAPDANGVISREGTSPPYHAPNVTLAVYGPGTPPPTPLPTETRFVIPTLSPYPTDSPVPPLATSSNPTQFIPLIATSTTTPGTPYPGPTAYP